MKWKALQPLKQKTGPPTEKTKCIKLVKK